MDPPTREIIRAGSGLTAMPFDLCSDRSSAVLFDQTGMVCTACFPLFLAKASDSDVLDQPNVSGEHG